MLNVPHSIMNVCLEIFIYNLYLMLMMEYCYIANMYFIGINIRVVLVSYVLVYQFVKKRN